MINHREGVWGQKWVKVRIEDLLGLKYSWGQKSWLMVPMGILTNLHWLVPMRVAWVLSWWQ